MKSTESLLSSHDVVVKNVDPLLGATLEASGKIPDFNRDIDKLYEYLYSHGFGDQISGPTIGLFYTEHGGRYVVAIPVKENITLEGNIKINTLPAIRCTSLLHTEGPETIEESFNKLKQYRKQHNIELVFPIREVYIPSQEKKGKYDIEIQIPIE